MRRLLLLMLLLALCAPPAPGGEEDRSRRVVFVPESEMDALLEKHGRGVLLDVNEYLKLWRLARQGRLEPETAPATDTVTLAGSFTGSVGDESAEFTLVYRIRVLRDGVRSVWFPIAGFGVIEATADGKPALLARSGKTGFLLLQGRGDHEVVVRGTARVKRKEEVRSFWIHLPVAASLAVDLSLPKGMVPTDAVLTALRSEETPEGVRLRGHLPPARAFSLAFRPKVTEGARSSLIHVRARNLHRVGPRVLRTASILQLAVYRKPIASLELTVPAGTLVTRVAAPGLDGWRQAADGRVRLAFRKETAGTVPIALVMTKDLPGPGDLELPEVRVASAADERGRTAVAFETGLRGRVLGSDGYARVPVAGGGTDSDVPFPKEKGSPFADFPLGGAAAAYRYWSADRKLSVRTEVPRGGVDCSASVLYSLLEEMRTIAVELVYRPRVERIFELRPVLPRGYDLRNIQIQAPAPHTYEREEDGTLAIRFPSGVPAEQVVRVTVTLVDAAEDWRAEDWTDLSLPLPVVEPGVTDGEVQGLLAVFADLGLDIRDRDLDGLKPEPVEGVGMPKARLAYRWRTRPGTGRITIERRRPKVAVRHVAFVRPGEKVARYTGYLHYTIERAGLRTFKFMVSGGYGDRLHVLAPGNVEPVRRTDEEGNDLWTVTLPRKVRGEVFLGLDLTEDLTDREGGRAFSFPEVTVLDVEDETGYLAVESGDNMRIEVTAGQLREIGIEEMNPLISRLGYRPARGLLAAYQYAAHPWSLSLLATRFEDKDVLTAFVTSAHLLTLIGEDGTVRCRATYRVLNADRQFLAVQLPESAVLWGALVDGKPVKPSVGEDAALIPLVTTGGERAIDVVLMYEDAIEALETSGDLRLTAPKLLDIVGAEAKWDVWLPSGFEAVGADGVFGATFGPPPEPWLYRAFEDLIENTRVKPGSRRWAGADSASPTSRPAAVEQMEYAQDFDVEARKSRRRDREIEEPVIKDAKVEDHNEAEADDMGEGTGGGEGAPPPMPSPKPQAPGQPGGGPSTPDAPPEADPGDESDNDLPMEESLGEKDFISDAPFDGPSTNAAIGVGGGAGGRFGGRGGRRTAPERIGRVGGLSLDVPLIAGGRRQSVRALGVHGDVRITYVNRETREASGCAVSVLTALLGLLLTGVLRGGGGVESRRVPPVVFVVLVLAFATFAPAWLGVRDLTIWDAVARGAFWAAVLLLAFRLVRFTAGLFTPRRAAAALVLLAAVAAAPLAQAGPDAEKPEETVYVPFDPDRLGDLGADGKVFLPFEKWKELWNAAHPDRRVEKPEDAPVPWLLTAAGYQGRVEGESVRIEASYDLVVLDEGWVEVPLLLTPAVAESATLDGEGVRVHSRKGAHVLMVRGKGAHRVKLALRTLLKQTGDRWSLEMSLPLIPRTLVTLELPFPDAEVQVGGVSPVQQEGRTVRVYLGPHSRLDLSFRKKTEAPRIDSRVEVDSRQAVLAYEGRVESRLRTTWRVVTGEISEARFRLDPDWDLVKVGGPDVKAWSADGEALVVTLGRVVKDQTVIEVTAERVDGARDRTVAVPRISPQGVVRERGLLAVTASPDLRVTLSGIRNVDRIASNAKDYGNLLDPALTLHSSWRFVLRPLGLTVATEPVRAEVRVEVPVMFTVARDFLLGRVSFYFDVRGDGTYEFPVRFPEDLEIDSVEGKELDHWWREGGVLTFSTASPVRGAFRPTVRFRRRLDPEVVAVPIPEIHAIGVTRERGRILVARVPEISLTVRTAEGLVKEDVKIYRSWQKILPRQVSAYGYRQDGEGHELVVARTFPEARVRPVTTTQLQVEDDQVSVAVHFVFAIENAGEDTFRVFLPEGEGEDPIVIADRSRAVTFEPVEEEGRKGRMLQVVLQQPAVGVYEFRLIYEKKLAAPDGDLRRGDVMIRALEAEGENPSAWVFAVNLSRGEVTFDSVKSLERAEVDSVPTLPRQLDRKLIRQVWRARESDWSLPVHLAIRDFADFPDARITSAEMLTAVGRDGWTRNRMTYRVLNRTRQFLAVTLPEGAVLEAVRVDGRAAKPGRRGEQVLVPLTRMQAGDVSTEVELYWSRDLGKGADINDLGRLRLLEPVIHGLDVERTFFTVVLPEGYSYTFDGNMERIQKAQQKLYRAKKTVEELKRVVEVQTAGGQAQQSRADDNYIRERDKVGRDLAQIEESLDVQGKAELAKLRTELNDLDETACQNLVLRAGVKAPQEGTVTRELLRDLAGKNAALARKQVEQQYRYKGKDNLANQSWGANSAIGQGLFKGPTTNAAIGLADSGAESQKQQADSLAWRAKFERIQDGTLAQKESIAFQGEDINLVPSGGFGFGIGQDAGIRTEGTSRGRPDEGRTSPRRALERSAPATRAGLLSLPVRVPERGEVFRFEKLNGGAELVVSVSKTDSGRGFGALGLFALVALVLAAFYRFRPHRKIPYFWPGVMLLLGVLAGAVYGAVFLFLAGLLASVVWFVSDFMERRRERVAHPE